MCFLRSTHNSLHTVLSSARQCTPMHHCLLVLLWFILLRFTNQLVKGAASLMCLLFGGKTCWNTHFYITPNRTACSKAKGLSFRTDKNRNERIKTEKCFPADTLFKLRRFCCYCDLFTHSWHWLWDQLSSYLPIPSPSHTAWSRQACLRSDHYGLFLTTQIWFRQAACVGELRCTFWKIGFCSLTHTAVLRALHL